MRIRCRLVVVFLFVGASLPLASNAQTQYCSSPYYVEQAFPTAGPEQTRWKLCWQVLNGPNLVITGAWFRPAPNAAWIKLIYDARVSQLFVPYHAGSPRYLDIGYGFGAVPLTAVDCPAPTGVILGTGNELCKQVRDRGIAWKHDALVRRGEELVLWSVMAAANYNYVVEWTFRDDGVVLGRVGATGQIAGTNAHIHGPIWRLDVDLNGACCDTVASMSHVESGATATDSMPDITTETGKTWDPQAFTMLHVRDGALKNSSGHFSEWHLMPTRDGTPMHQEAFTKKRVLGYPLQVVGDPRERLANLRCSAGDGVQQRRCHLVLRRPPPSHPRRGQQHDAHHVGWLHAQACRCLGENPALPVR